MKTLRFLLINLFVKDHKKTLEIINGLDHPLSDRSLNSKCPDHIGNYLLSDDFEDVTPVVKSDNRVSKIQIEDSPRVKTKKDELLDALNYLRSKPDKSKQDKDSIYTLEVLLKNIS